MTDQENMYDLNGDGVIDAEERKIMLEVLCLMLSNLLKVWFTSP